MANFFDELSKKTKGDLIEAPTQVEVEKVEKKVRDRKRLDNFDIMTIRQAPKPSRDSMVFEINAPGYQRRVLANLDVKENFGDDPSPSFPGVQPRLRRRGNATLGTGQLDLPTLVEETPVTSAASSPRARRPSTAVGEIPGFGGGFTPPAGPGLPVGAPGLSKPTLEQTTGGVQRPEVSGFGEPTQKPKNPRAQVGESVGEFPGFEKKPTPDTMEGDLDIGAILRRMMFQIGTAGVGAAIGGIAGGKTGALAGAGIGSRLAGQGLAVNDALKQRGVTNTLRQTTADTAFMRGLGRLSWQASLKTFKRL